MKFLQEFREFAVKGNVVDLAVGIIIGASFGAIVKSLVDDVIMPVVGLVTGGVDFQNKYVVLKRGVVPENQTVETAAEAKAAGWVTLNYGVFINSIVTFLIVAFAVFLLVKQVNRLRRERKTKALDPSDKKCPFCLSTIPIQATRCAHCTSALGAGKKGR